VAVVKTDTAEYRWGAAVEGRVAAWLVANRCAVVKVAHGAVVAPTMDAWAREVGCVYERGHKIILPDLQAFDFEGGNCWIEVKAKGQCATHMNWGNALVTGVEQRVLDHYRRIKRVTEHPVWLVFVHTFEAEVRYVECETPSNVGSGAGRGMAFWRWDRLKRLCSLTDLTAARPLGHTRLELPFFDAPIQRSLFPKDHQ
jgi:hypothetical protein